MGRLDEVGIEPATDGGESSGAAEKWAQEQRQHKPADARSALQRGGEADCIANSPSALEVLPYLATA